MTPNLSFGSLNNATTNGSSLSATGIGALNYGVNQPINNSNTGIGSPNVFVASPTVPNVGGEAQTGGAGNFWSRDGGAGMILGGVQVLGNLWSSYQQHKMAKEQMAFAREQWDTNLANQTQTYNTALEDRIRARHSYTGQGEGDTSQYLDKHSL